MFQEHFIFVNGEKLAQNFEFKFSNNFEEFFFKDSRWQLYKRRSF
ncbi:MAG: hypothetical protein ACJA17_000435 [Polaribacter sp.]|jgi:hypothetical protein